MIRFLAEGDGPKYEFGFFEDHGFTNEFDQWTDLLAGSTTVVAEIATAAIAADPEARPPVKPEPQGAWKVFEAPTYPWRNGWTCCRSNIAGVAKGVEYVVRVTVSGVTYDQISVRLD